MFSSVFNLPLGPLYSLRPLFSHSSHSSHTSHHSHSSIRALIPPPFVCYDRAVTISCVRAAFPGETRRNAAEIGRLSGGVFRKDGAPGQDTTRKAPSRVCCYPNIRVEQGLREHVPRTRRPRAQGPLDPGRGRRDIRLSRAERLGQNHDDQAGARPDLPDLGRHRDSGHARHRQRGGSSATSATCPRAPTTPTSCAARKSCAITASSTAWAGPRCASA